MKNKSEISSRMNSNIKMLLFCSPFFVFAILISFISVLVNTNGVLNSYAFLLLLINVISSLCDIFIYAISFAFIINAVSKRKISAIPFAIFTVLAFFRYFVSAIIGGVIRGAVTREDMISAAIVLGVDVVITGILTATAYIIRNCTDKDKKDTSKVKPSKSRLFPELSDSIKKGILAAGILWAMIRVASQIIYDVSYITIIGAPSVKNIMWMVIYYISAILICPIFCIISSFTVKLIRKGQDSSF